jgi:hypothetical protein
MAGFRQASALQAGTSTPIVANLPAPPAVNDIIIISAVVDAGGGTTVSGPSGYTVAGNVINTAPNPDTVLAALWKQAAGADANPSIAAAAGAGNFFGLLAMLFGGVDPTTPMDVAAVTGISASNANEWNTVPAITTVTNNALVVSIVGVNLADPLGLNLKSGQENGFELIVGGSSYISIAGSDAGFGVAVYKKVTAGVVTMPIWENGPTPAASWCGVTMALRPDAGGSIKIHNGTAWIDKPVKRHDGSSWGTKPEKRHNGSAWVNI